MADALQDAFALATAVFGETLSPYFGSKRYTR